MSEPIYPKGLTMFNPNDKAPEFVKGQLIITLNDLIDFCKENPNYLSEYNGKKQLKLDLLTGKKGLYLKVNTYKAEAPPVNVPEQKAQETAQPDKTDENSLPF